MQLLFRNGGLPVPGYNIVPAGIGNFAAFGIFEHFVRSNGKMRYFVVFTDGTDFRIHTESSDEPYAVDDVVHDLKF
jgi:hypothetical protein